MKDFTGEQQAFLSRHGFDAALFARWRADVAAGRLTKARNAVRQPLRLPPADAIVRLPEAGSPAHGELARRGAAAIANGELGVVVLNGGMATRFGGVVKGIVEVLPGRSFLALTAEDVLRAQREHGGRVHLFLMNSFATDAATRAHFAEHRNFGLDPAQVHHFTQFVSVRLDPDGNVFRTDDGAPSFYGPGHGDFAGAFRRALLKRFLDGGGRLLLVRNVDNLGARIDSAVLGHHLAAGVEATAEVTEKRAGDVGGAPWLLDGKVQLVEQIRYPPGFDAAQTAIFNTNTFTFTAQALDRDFDLGWYFVEKEVEGRKAVQIEHLIGELTAFLRTSYLEVPRDGAASRFVPAKTPADLEAVRPLLAAMYGERPNG